MQTVRCKKNKGYNRASLMWMQSNGKQQTSIQAEQSTNDTNTSLSKEVQFSGHGCKFFYQQNQT